MNYFLFCSSQQAIAHAGPNVDANIASSSAILEDFSKEAEGTIALKMRMDVSAAWANDLDLPIKQAIGSATARLIAADLIAQNMEGYTGLNEASTMVDILKDTSDTIIKDILKDENQKLNK